MKLYVIGPMSNYPEYNYPAFHEAAGKLRAAGYDVLSPAEVPLPCGCVGLPPQCGADDHHWREFVRAGLIAMLGHSEGVALLGRWWKSRGARLEYEIAYALEMDIRTVDEWLAA